MATYECVCACSIWWINKCSSSSINYRFNRIINFDQNIFADALFAKKKIVCGIDARGVWCAHGVCRPWSMNMNSFIITYYWIPRFGLCWACGNFSHAWWTRRQPLCWRETHTTHIHSVKQRIQMNYIAIRAWTYWCRKWMNQLTVLSWPIFPFLFQYIFFFGLLFEQIYLFSAQTASSAHPPDIFDYDRRYAINATHIIPIIVTSHT